MLAKVRYNAFGSTLNLLEVGKPARVGLWGLVTANIILIVAILVQNIYISDRILNLTSRTLRYGLTLTTSFLKVYIPSKNTPK